MIYKMEAAGEFFEPVVFRTEDDIRINALASRVSEMLGLDSSRMHIDVVISDDNGYNKEVVSCDETSDMKLKHAICNIGDEMILKAGYDRVIIRLRGITFE